jgi:hypothetical protein
MAEEYQIGKDIAEVQQRISTLEYQLQKLIEKISSEEQKDESSRA